MLERIIYLIIVIGILVMESDVVVQIYKGMKNSFSIKRDLRLVSKQINNREGGKVYKHLMRLISASDMEHIFISPEHFIYLCVFIFSFMFIGLMIFLDFRDALILATGFAAIPYAVLTFKLSGKRAKGSREAVVLVQELTNNYQINSCNMREAIEATAISIEASATVKRVMINLAKNLNNASSSKEIGEAVENFRYAFGTAWADILSANIFIAVYRGIRVENSLRDLGKSIANSKKIVEHSRRQGYEARIMIRYMMPICMLMTIISARMFFGMSIGEYMLNQFSNKSSMYWLLTSIFLYLGACFTDMFFASRKMDL